ncbi:NUDIX hydrolase [Candidatus Saccharibacteria bacterium]|nr:NUDIX hydrolase [Candidatus Saccharibacteria bacterium]
MKMNPAVPQCYYRVSVKALITNQDGEVLVVNERGTGWDLPGGGLDWGEATIEALHREIEEELGCTAVIDPQPVMIVPSNKDKHNQHVLWIIHRAKIDRDAITPTDDVQEKRFMSVADFRSLEDESLDDQWECPIDFWAELQALIER